MSWPQIIQDIYTMLNVASVTSLLSTAYGTPAIFYKTAPQSADSEAPGAFPYVTYFVAADPGNRTNQGDGHAAVLQVNVFHRTQSATALAALAQSVYDQIHRQPMPTLIGHITTEGQDWADEDDPDGRTKIARLQFRILSLNEGV